MSSDEKRKEYLKSYQKFHYRKTRKMVTFALFNKEHEEFKKRADKLGFTANTLAKKIILNYINNNSNSFETTEQKELFKEYMRISRGIANNINQLAYSSNIGDVIDVNILINSLKRYEDEFKKLLAKVL